MGMTLSELLLKANIAPTELQGDAAINSIVMDSRKALAGSLFVCMPGMTRESESFIPDAVDAGATAALVHSPAGLVSARSYGLAAALVSPKGNSFPDFVWRLCDAFFDHPTRSMKVVGVTGTNGKTTTAWLVRDMLNALGEKSAYLGTLGFYLPDQTIELGNTTPFAVELYNYLAMARASGVTALAMEVSSHALAEQRADGVEFDTAVFSNLTQDHLDFHGTMEAYEAAKWRLFRELPKQTQKAFSAVINIDDACGERWHQRLGEIGTPVHLYSRMGKEGAWAFESKSLKVSFDSITGKWLNVGSAPIGKVDAKLGGSYNVENLLSAMTAMVALGYEPKDVVKAASSVHPVPGRFEAVQNHKGIGVIVDYAHTPDALEKLLDAVRPLTKGKVITVFGCGGDRDRTKRPKMARAASERSDLVIVTSDNPRTEDPKKILRDILPGLIPKTDSLAIVDREEAIREAIKRAKTGDVVVIAGKGHEDYQIIGRTKHHMDDRELARTALENKK